MTWAPIPGQPYHTMWQVIAPSVVHPQPLPLQPCPPGHSCSARLSNIAVLRGSLDSAGDVAESCAKVDVRVCEEALLESGYGEPDMLHI